MRRRNAAAEETAVTTDINDRVLLDIENGVATLTLNRPNALNALDPALADALSAGLSRCEEDDAIRAVVLRGAGENFMAGGDIKMFAGLLNEPDGPRRGYFERLIHQVHASILIMRRMPKPIVASVRGAALHVARLDAAAIVRPLGRRRGGLAHACGKFTVATVATAAPAWR